MKMIKLTEWDDSVCYYNTAFIMGLEAVPLEEVEASIACNGSHAKVRTKVLLADDNLDVVYVQENLDDILERLYVNIL